MSELKQVPLHAFHLSLNANMVGFAGWEMPVFYTGIVREHTAVREKVGVFEISHMGQFFISGPTAGSWLNGLLCNDVGKLAPGKGQYTLFLNEEGGVIDDLILYRQNKNDYFMVVNASKIEEVEAWLDKHNNPAVSVHNRSSEFGGMAVQGPEAPEIFRALAGEEEFSRLPARNEIREFAVDGSPALVCRTGYTGEDGFEWFCPAGRLESFFRKALDAGAVPCGLGARDTLRLEMGYPLNGADLTPDRTPLEAGLGFFVSLKKEADFIGRDRLAAQKAEGPPSRLVAFRMLKKGPPPRAHYPVCNAQGDVLGEIASGGLSPSLGMGIGMAYLPPEYAKPGAPLQIDIRGRKHLAEVVKKPFLQR